MQGIVEMKQIHQVTGKVKHLIIYENKAILKNEKDEEIFSVHYNPENVDWEIINIAECMVIDDIVYGFDLTDYFGDDYSVVTKLKR